MKNLVDFAILLLIYFVPFILILTLFQAVQEAIAKRVNKNKADRYPVIKTVRRKYE